MKVNIFTIMSTAWCQNQYWMNLQNESENFAVQWADEKSHWQKIVNFPDDINLDKDDWEFWWQQQLILWEVHLIQK